MTFRTTFIRSVPLLAALAALAALPTSASAMLVGAESNGELANSDRTPVLQGAALDKMQDQGVQVVRANFAWNEVAPACAGQTLEALRSFTNPCYNWAILDNLVLASGSRGMSLLLSTSRAPIWLHGSRDPYYVGASQAQLTRFADHYAAFLTAAGSRYVQGSPFGTVRHWTIWNEPNSNTFWKPRPSGRDYAFLYGKAAVALRNANPTALIAPGPTGPKSTVKPLTFLRDFQTFAPGFLPGSGAAERRYLNAWAHNPYPGAFKAPSMKSTLKAPSVGIYNVRDLFRELDRSPLTRSTPVWATEFGWETIPDRVVGISYARQAQYLGEAYDWLDRTGRVQIGIWYGLTDPRDPRDWQSGTFASSGAAKPSFRMYQRMISVPAANGRVKRGQVVKVWGRSNLSKQTAYIVYRRGTSGRWIVLPKTTRRSDGSMFGQLRLTAKTTQFAVWDRANGTAAGTYGMFRQVSAS